MVNVLLLNITAFTCIIRLKRHQTRHSALWYLYFFPAIDIKISQLFSAEEM